MTSTLSITSSEFQNNTSIPAKYTCDAGEATVNPPLRISGVPAGTVSLVLIMDDPDIPGGGVFDHWVLFNIPPTTADISSGETVGLVGRNSTGRSAYAAPCPPPQYEPSEHRYMFKLFALDVMLDLPSGSSRADIEDALEGHVLDETLLTGLYKRK